MSDGDTRGFPTYSKSLSSLISRSAINAAATARNTRDTIESGAHKHSQDTTDTHIPTTSLSDCLSPSSLVSLSHTNAIGIQ